MDDSSINSKKRKISEVSHEISQEGEQTESDSSLGDQKKEISKVSPEQSELDSQVSLKGEEDIDHLPDDVMRTLLIGLNHEYLCEILIDISKQNNKYYKLIEEIISRDPSSRKLFIHGLNYQTTSEELYSQFSAYGPIQESAVVTDKNTGKSKGFAFVTMADLVSTQKVLDNPPARLGGRTIYVKLASQKQPQDITSFSPSSSSDDLAGRKIFVRQLSYQTTSNTLKEVFQQFGEIEETVVVSDPVTNKSKGYGFIVFTTIESTKKALVSPIKLIDGRSAICKLAVHQDRKPKEIIESKPSGSSSSVWDPYAASQKSMQIQQPQMQYSPQYMQSSPGLAYNQPPYPPQMFVQNQPYKGQGQYQPPQGYGYSSY